MKCNTNCKIFSPTQFLTFPIRPHPTSPAAAKPKHPVRAQPVCPIRAGTNALPAAQPLIFCDPTDTKPETSSPSKIVASGSKMHDLPTVHASPKQLRSISRQATRADVVPHPRVGVPAI